MTDHMTVAAAAERLHHAPRTIFDWFLNRERNRPGPKLTRVKVGSKTFVYEHEVEAMLQPQKPKDAKVIQLHRRPEGASFGDMAKDMIGAK